MRRTPFSRFSKSVDFPQFSPHVPRRENSGESSVSCSRVLSSLESRSSGRGSREDKRARSREVGSRGRRRRSRSRSSCRSRSSGRERGRRSSSASRSSRGRSRCERSRSSDRYRSRGESSRSRRDRSRSLDRYRSRRDRSRRERLRSCDRYRSRRGRARSPARRGERRGRSRSHTLPNRSRDRSRSSVLLPASPARLWTEKQDGWPDVDPRRVWRRLPLSLLWPGAAAGVPPVAGGASITALPSVLQELAKFFMNLSGSSSLGATGDLAGVTASAAASGGIACPASTAAGAATICAATVTPAGAGVLPAAPAAVPGMSGEQQRQGESRSRGRRSRSSGDGTDRRAKSAPEEGLLLLTALRVIGGGAVALSQIRLSMTELTLLLPVPGMRLEVRILVALPGILTARLVLGRRGLLQGVSLAGLGRVVIHLHLRVWRMMTAPLPSLGFDWREVAWVAFPSPLASSRQSGGSPVLLVSRFWAGFFHPLLGAPLLGRLSVVLAAGLTAVSLACGLALAVFRAVAGCHEGIDGPFFLAFGRRERLLLIYPGLFWT